MITLDTVATDTPALMRWLARQGLRPLLVDWGEPGPAEASFNLDAYVTGPLHELVASLGTPVTLAGYCLGGTLAWAVAAAAEPSCCVSYYGSGVPSMLGMIDQVGCPTLFHFGNADPYIPNEGVDAVGAAIAGRDGFVLNVEHAGHAFENHEAEMFWNEAAAKSSTAKTLAFLAEHA